MTMPVYVSPEQIMKDRADYARKGIARGRSVVVLSYEGGIAFVAENPRALHKISEIYDRIAFAAVGKYNEFENLRVAGVRLRRPARLLVRPRATSRRAAWRTSTRRRSAASSPPTPKPLRGRDWPSPRSGATQDADEIYRISYDGSVADVPGYVAMGGQADAIATALGERWREGLSLSEALGLAVELLGRDAAGNSTPLAPAQLEVAVLDRQRPRRAFRRLAGSLLERLLQPDDPTSDVPHTDDPRPGLHDTLTGEGDGSPRGLTTDRPATTCDPSAAPPLPMPGPPPRVGVMDRRIFGIETSTASPAPSRASAGCRRTRWPATCSARSSRGAGRATSSCVTAPASTSTSASTPSTRRPSATTSAELVVHDKAGERILEGLLVDAERRLHEEGIAGEVYLFKNNTDSAGNSYGCHENYLVSRHGEFGRLADVLIPFLVTRQLICGAGKVLQTPRGAVFCLSASGPSTSGRASRAPPRARRPIINTRDEPHADAERTGGCT